ncbi:hypothetical protein FACS189434_03080 [Bacteroidia bacterium]|nr:hypothetical protein FACS189434_03080 [Bacteroidia bacterium]
MYGSLFVADAQTSIVNGIKVPRLTTVERNQIQASGNPYALGQLIYNMDTDCLNFWNGTEWTELCLGEKVPVVDVPQADCGKIRVHGQYYKSAPLNQNNYLTVPFTVTKEGDYKLIASSGNGYYFQAVGTFQTPGNYELKLDAMGTPTNSGTDQLTITCNGVVIAASCAPKVTVGTLTMSYRTDELNIQVFGNYQTRQFMSSTVNYVKVPIDVIVDGTTTVETNMVNGIKFTATKTLTQLGADTLIFKAQGSPKQSGKYRYTFTTDGGIKTTISFDVTFTSSLGTFDDPACKCLDIYEERPDVGNGEYWLYDCVATTGRTVKTYCDIENGGWTLVWSYSEKTARSTYTPTNDMQMTPATYSLFKDLQRNPATTSAATINYNDYRLNRAEWQHFPNSTSKPQIKVRIATNPTDMDDQWALNNYAIISPRNTGENPIETDFNDWRARVPVEGKLFGRTWAVKASGGGNNGGVWNGVNHGDMGMYNSNGYMTHWNFANVSVQGLFQVVPNLGGGNNEVQVSNINNAFGWWGENEVNHHFGKCTTDDYSFSTKTCGHGSLVPHSFNSGEGRYIQWFVK